MRIILAHRADLDLLAFMIDKITDTQEFPESIYSTQELNRLRSREAEKKAVSQGSNKKSPTSNLVAQPALIASAVFFSLGYILALIRPYTHEEAVVWFMSSQGFAYLFEKLGSSGQPPLFYIFSSVLSVFGSLFLIRLFSIFCYAVGIGVLAYRASFNNETARWALAMLLGTSPFLVFCSYFALSSGLAFVLIICCFLLLEKHLEASGIGPAILVGANAGLILMTSFKAAFCVLPIVFGIMIWNSVRRKNFKDILIGAIPFWICCLICGPILFSGSGVDTETAGKSLSIFGHLVYAFKALFILPFSFINSDGMPPWTVLGLINLAVGVLILVLSGTIIIRERDEKLKIYFIGIAFILVVSIIAGLSSDSGKLHEITFQYSWLYIVWFALLLLIPAVMDKLNPFLITLMGISHFMGLVGLIFFQTSSVPDYQVPNKDIQSAVSEIIMNYEKPVVLFSNDQELQQLQIAYEKGKVSIPINTCTKDPKTIIMITKNGQETWPPNAVAKNVNCQFTKEYDMIEERFMHRESGSAMVFKDLFSNQIRYEYKVSISVYVRRDFENALADSDTESNVKADNKETLHKEFVMK